MNLEKREAVGTGVSDTTVPRNLVKAFRLNAKVWVWGEGHGKVKAQLGGGPLRCSHGVKDPVCASDTLLSLHVDALAA